MKKYLVIVDCQNDFIDKDGSLFVKECETKHIINKIYNLLSNDSFDTVIFTADYHSKSNKSFSINGGQWPVHCVQNTKGSMIPTELLDKCVIKHYKTYIIHKGTNDNVEEYGAFGKSRFILKKSFLELKGESNNKVLIKSKDLDNIEFIVCGVAGDFCVKETAMNLSKYGKVRLCQLPTS